MNFLALKIPPLLLMLLFAGVMALTMPFATLPPALWRIVLAAILALLGVTVMLAGVRAFRRAKTTVNPVHPEQATALVCSGIYRITRNPMYLGFLLLLLAWALVLANVPAMSGPVIFIVYMNRFQIRQEEQILAQMFGQPYQDYCAEVRRWL